MLSILGWLPVVGPILDGIGRVISHFTDRDIAIAKVNGEVTIEGYKAANQITLAFVNDIAVRLARDIVMFPGSAWCGLYIWDKIVAHHYPWLVYDVAPLDGPMVYLPYALMTFFFGAAWLNRK
jgi:hypothetical protein